MSSKSRGRPAARARERARIAAVQPPPYLCPQCGDAPSTARVASDVAAGDVACCRFCQHEICTLASNGPGWAIYHNPLTGGIACTGDVPDKNLQAALDSLP